MSKLARLGPKRVGVVILFLLITPAFAGSQPMEGTNWESGGRDNTEQHFSPLSQINGETIGKLGLLWSLDLPGEHSLEATPLAVDGVLYFSGQTATVYAVDARSGSLLWRWDPEEWKRFPKRLRLLFSANRGVAYRNGKVYVGTFNGELVALDAHTGRKIWSVQTFDVDSHKYSAGAPRIVGHNVLIGNGGADYGERGFLSAYDAETGKLAWRFFAAPASPDENRGDAAMEMAAKTWSGQYWKTGTGGTMWDGFTYDPELNRLYVGTGNSGPYNPAVRSPGNGDNLFLTSIVALNATTGKYVWHYQVNPREAWDYKATANIILATMEIGDRATKVLLQLPTNGFFYVINRETGKLISAQPVGKVTWASSVDLRTGRPVEREGIRYESGTTTIWPGPWGAHNWQPMAYSPLTQLAYIPFMQVGARWSVAPGAALGGTVFAPIVAEPDDAKGKLVAWDPARQSVRWSVPRATMWNGGVLATAGNLVFQGTEEGFLEAYDDATGRSTWSFDCKLGIIGAPISYSVDGKQLVSILVGYGGASALQSTFNRSGWKYNAQPRRLLTFALGGPAKLPATQARDFTVSIRDDPSLLIDEAQAAHGAILYGANGCGLCHGDAAISAGVPAPDLRESATALKLESFSSLLYSGALAAEGMPQFEDLSPSDTKSIHMYLRARAREDLNLRKPAEYGPAASQH